MVLEVFQWNISVKYNSFLIGSLSFVLFGRSFWISNPQTLNFTTALKAVRRTAMINRTFVSINIRSSYVWAFIYLLTFYGCITNSQHDQPPESLIAQLVACSAGVLLERVSVTTLRPPSVRLWGMGEGKSEKIFLAPPLPYPSSCLSFTHSVEVSFSLQSSTAWKIHDGGRTFYDVSAGTKKSRLLLRLLSWLSTAPVS